MLFAKKKKSVEEIKEEIEDMEEDIDELEEDIAELKEKLKTKKDKPKAKPKEKITEIKPEEKTDAIPTGLDGHPYNRAVRGKTVKKRHARGRFQ